MYKQFKYKKLFSKVIGVGSVFLLTFVLFFSCTFSPNAVTQAYFNSINPVSASLYNQETISKLSGFNLFDTVNNFSSPIGANHSLSLYRYRLDYNYSWTAGQPQSFSAVFDLTKDFIIQPGSYRIRFYTECGTNEVYSPWWQDKNESERNSYIDQWFKPGNLATDLTFTYLTFGTSNFVLIPTQVGTVSFSDGASRFLEFYDYTFTTDVSISNASLNVATRFNLGLTGSSSLSTRFTCGVSQASIYQVYNSSADAPIFPTPDNKPLDDLQNIEGSLNDFRADSGADDFLDSSNINSALGSSAINGMRGISSILQYAYDEWSWLRTLIYFSVSLGLIGLLFNLGTSLFGRKKGG